MREPTPADYFRECGQASLYDHRIKPPGRNYLTSPRFVMGKFVRPCVFRVA